MIILALLAFCFVMIRCFPETALGHLLKKTLVEEPLERLANMKRRHVIFLLVAAAFFFVAGEYAWMFGAGEWLSLTVSLSYYFDAVLVTSAVMIVGYAMTTWRSARSQISTWLRVAGRSVRRAGRGIRAPRRRTLKSPDDEDAPAAASYCYA